MARSSGSVSVAAGRPRPAQEGLRLGGPPGGHGERAEHAVALGARREIGDLAAVRRRARRVAVLEHPGDGLEHAPLPVGRVRALPGGFDEARGGRGPRLAVRLAAREGLQVGRERGVGDRRRGDPVPQHRRGLGRPDAAAAVCRALRRATPSESCTADRTSGCGKATVTGVPGPGSAMRPAAVVSSNGASGSSSPANDATCGSGLCMPSTAAASTRSRAAAEQPDQRSLTTRRNERGEGSGRSPVPHDLRRELGEQRPGVQRVAPCAVAQATGGHRRQRRSELGREVAQLGLGEPGQRDGGARLPVDDPAKALRQPGDRVPYADQDQHLVGDQPPQCEQQRREGRPVGPVRVVDDHHDHSLVACLVVAVEQLAATACRR